MRVMKNNQGGVWRHCRKMRLVRLRDVSLEGLMTWGDVDHRQPVPQGCIWLLIERERLGVARHRVYSMYIGFPQKQQQREQAHSPDLQRQRFNRGSKRESIISRC